jgi:hypothetical protein
MFGENIHMFIHQSRSAFVTIAHLRAFYSVEEDGLIAPSLEAVPLGPQPPLLIAAAGSSTSFGLLQLNAKSHALNGNVIETHEHAGDFKEP